MEEVIFIDTPPLCSDRRYPRGGRSSPRWSFVCPAVKQQCFAMSPLRTRQANCSVVGWKNQHQCLCSVPATEQQKWQWLRLIFFNDSVPAAVCVSLYVCANHFTLDCFGNEGQYKAGCHDTDPCKRISPNHTGPSNCTRATDKCCSGLIVFIVTYEYGEVSWKLAN